MKKLLFGICLIISLLLSAQTNSKVTSSGTSDKGEKISSQESNIWEVFHTRRSVRAFRSDSIPEKDILKIIDAARMSPTSTPLGVPVEWPKTPEKKKLEEFISFDKL